MVKNENSLGKTEEKKGNERICYICKEKKAGISSEYSKKFSRTGINKIFTTTTINTSHFLQNFNYDNTYSMCAVCYQKLLSGEKTIAEQFKSKIAGEDAFIIPEGILQNFEYKFLKTLRTDVDLAFNSKDAKEWIDTVESEIEESNVEEYAINFIFYRTDGNSVSILETIQDVPSIRFKKVMEILAKYSNELKSQTYNISIGSIYRLIPVKTNRTGEQLDVGRVLSLYKAILSGEKINYKILFEYVTEGLEKGLRQLNKSKIDNYYNMGLTRYINGYEDFFIKKIIFGYIVLFKTCQHLDVLDYNILKSFGKDGDIMEKFETPSKDVNSSIVRIEEFLDKQGFNFDARALFYLGVLVNRVAVAQMHKEHRKKPILKKIQFQGMNEKEINIFYQDIVEKLRQYNVLTLFSEGIMNRFHYYHGSLDKKWPLNDKENVFYIMAGYAYMVGKNAPDLTEEETEAQKLVIEDQENEE